MFIQVQLFVAWYLSIYYWGVTWSPTPSHLPFAIIGRLVWNPRPGRLEEACVLKKWKQLGQRQRMGERNNMWKQLSTILILRPLDSWNIRWSEHMMIVTGEHSADVTKATHSRCSWHQASDSDWQDSDCLLSHPKSTVHARQALTALSMSQETTTGLPSMQKLY